MGQRHGNGKGILIKCLRGLIKKLAFEQRLVVGDNVILMSQPEEKLFRESK